MATRPMFFSPTTVLTTTEAREAVPRLAQRFHREGIAAGIVYYGPQRQPHAAIVPIELLEALAPFVEDLVVAEALRSRRREDSGVRYSLAELDEIHGFGAERIEEEVAQLERDLGPGS